MKKNATPLKLIASDGQRTPIIIAQDPLGSGADANIHRVDGHPEMVVKIYHDPSKDPRRPEKIQAMLDNPPNLPPIRENGSDYVQITWPTGMVEDQKGRFTGYAMPFVDLKRSTVLENLLAKKTRQVMGLPEFYGYRVVAAANLAALVAALHACGHHIIDLKPVNLNVYTDKFYIALLDCDGLSIQGDNDRWFNAHQYTDGYIAPEALQGRQRPQDLGEDQDRFALAVILFQLLNRGIHPYQGVPRKGAKVPPTNSERIQRKLYAYGKKPNPLLGPSPWSIHKYLEDDTRKLFDRAFGSHSGRRPSAEEWKRHLHKLADPSTGLLKKCNRKVSHGMFTKGCGFCHMEGVVKKRSQHKAKSKKRKNRSPRQTVTPLQTYPQRTAAVQAGARPPMSLKKRLLIVAAILCVIAAAILFPKMMARSNIHAVIERNDQETFFKRAASPNFNWSEFEAIDIRRAVSFEDQRIFDALVLNMFNLPYNRQVFMTLMERSRLEILELYIERVERIPADLIIMRHIRATGVAELQEKYRGKAEGLFDLYADVFKRNDIGAVREILGWGANPNMPIKDHGDYVEKLHKNKAFYPNHIDLSGCRRYPLPAYDMCISYQGPFKAPGAGVMSDLRRFRRMLKFSLAGREAPKPYSGFGRYSRLSLSHSVYPLTIAVLKGNLEMTRVLLEAGASLNDKIPNHESIYELASDFKMYQALKSKSKTSNAIEQALAEDDPRKLSEALNKAQKEGQPPNRKKLKQMATRVGSVRCFDMLQRRWKGSHGMNSLAALFDAYHSHNPLMLGYYLAHIIPYDRIYTYKQIHKAAPHKGKTWLFFRYDVVSGLADRKNQSIKIGDCLLEMARQDKSWAMAFVLDDHQSKWSDLHLAVLSEDVPKINDLLQRNPKRIEERDAKGRTALGLAAQYECNASYDFLNTLKPNLAARDKNGYTPIMHAASYGNVRMVQDLLDKRSEKDSAIGGDCDLVLKITQENEEIADHIESMVSTHQLGGVPSEFFRYTKNIHDTHHRIQTACGVTEDET